MKSIINLLQYSYYRVDKEVWVPELTLSSCWRRLLRVPWTARRSNQSNLKEINPEYSLEGLMLKLQYFGHLMRRADSLEKTDAGKEWWQEKGMTEDKMVEWHYWLNGHEFEQTSRDSEGQGSLACCSPWGASPRCRTWLSNWTTTRHSCTWPKKKQFGLWTHTENFHLQVQSHKTSEMFVRAAHIYTW